MLEHRAPDSNVGDDLAGNRKFRLAKIMGQQPRRRRRMRTRHAQIDAVAFRRRT